MGLLELTGVETIEVGDAEAQAMLERRRGNEQLMGSRTDRKMEQIAEHYADKPLDENQRKVVDVFSGRADNQIIEVERAGGIQKVVMRQGTENRAGAKHSLYRHFETRSNYVTSADIEIIPEVIAKGERSVDGKKVVYDYTTPDGSRLRVTTEINDGRERFTNYLSNRKPRQSDRVKPQEGNTQLSAHSSDAEVSDAKLQNKFSIGKSERDKDYLDALAREDREAYDDQGEAIPLSEGFDERNGDVRYLTKPDGRVYGWTVGGKVYLNRDAMNPETPVHEYTHLWDEMVRRENPELWERGKELMKPTPLWDEIRNYVIPILLK